ncbi:MgtC/SapB family protein [Sutcliffiella deserti]|uniref:MgtC/SapB family protein n=1 Tax=Sutcliffiella deserti TaxID=2875501 RepID=UPI001CBBBBBB|nr:MgtC/SapB family protein [Sutcliffiella deserti]
MVVLLSGIVGFERETKNRPAGLRTHILVGLGSCLLMLLSLYGFEDYISRNNDGIIKMDPARIPSYVISGIGFLGAGTIMVHGGVSVRGLTTAASVWMTAALGLVIGAGMFFEGILTTAIVLFTLHGINVLESKDESIVLTVVTEKQDGILSEMKSILREHDIEIVKIDMEEYKPANNIKRVKYNFLVNLKKTDQNPEVIEKIQNLPYVHKTSMV